MILNTKKNNLSFVNVNDAIFRKSWEIFLESYPQYNYYYQLHVIEYFKLLSDEVLYQSFIVKNDDTPLAICVLIFENYNGNLQASMSHGGYLPIPLFHQEM